MKILLLVLCTLFLVGCGGNTPKTITIKPYIPPSPSVFAQSTPQAATATTTPSPTATVPMPSPTPKHRMAPTTVPSVIPKLGNTIAMWDAYYGKCVAIPATQMSLCEYHDDTFQPQSDIIVGYEPSLDNRVFTISVVLTQNNSKLPSLFLPADAVVAGTQNGAHLWISKQLAAEFPASYFIDNTGASVQAGTCNIFAGATQTTLSLGATFGP